MELRSVVLQVNHLSRETSRTKASVPYPGKIRYCTPGILILESVVDNEALANEPDLFWFTFIALDYHPAAKSNTPFMASIFQAKMLITRY